MSTLDQIAPYPKSEAEATAESLRTALMARAYAVFWAMPEDPEGTLDAFLVTQACGVAHLLGRFLDRDGADVADAVARHLWTEWRDLDGLGLDLVTALERAGIDRDSVIDAVDPRGAAVQADPQAGTGVSG